MPSWMVCMCLRLCQDDISFLERPVAYTLSTGRWIEEMNEGSALVKLTVTRFLLKSPFPSILTPLLLPSPVGISTIEIPTVHCYCLHKIIDTWFICQFVPLLCEISFFSPIYSYIDFKDCGRRITFHRI